VYQNIMLKITCNFFNWLSAGKQLVGTTNVECIIYNEDFLP